MARALAHIPDPDADPGYREDYLKQLLYQLKHGFHALPMELKNILAEIAEAPPEVAQGFLELLVDEGDDQDILSDFANAETYAVFRFLTCEEQVEDCRMIYDAVRSDVPPDHMVPDPLWIVEHEIGVAMQKDISALLDSKGRYNRKTGRPLKDKQDLLFILSFISLERVNWHQIGEKLIEWFDEE